MKKRNIIDFHQYRVEPFVEHDETEPTVSEELEDAIRNLIRRMRELGPIPQGNAS